MESHDREPLDPLFDALRGEMAKLDAPRGVEKELLQAFARQFPRQAWYRKPAVRRWALAGGLSSAVTAVTVLGLMLHDPRLAADPDARGRPLASHDGGLFIALESPERIEQEPAPRMVETEVSRSSLAPLGVPLTPENAGDTVKAEMLLGADGRPLAVRLTSIE
ncbi:hypothetical protein AB595_19065 [Massilia sp. WF1]|uniref:hypothetical protein n=1 Tax=unclassified Massilia TaxID=2609279 RepID=UPI00064964CF|nr:MULTISPECIES: hypothetical protein [unclassified Massilia]ALK95582.1 hypothetical protein AM586_04005 [Massilia sp. WG5]KLU35244.1 hypothetical protein AB595_19065 [Massilia sp. WF1]